MGSYHFLCSDRFDCPPDGTSHVHAFEGEGHSLMMPVDHQLRQLLVTVVVEGSLGIGDMDSDLVVVGGTVDIVHSEDMDNDEDGAGVVDMHEGEEDTDTVHLDIGHLEDAHIGDIHHNKDPDDVAGVAHADGVDVVDQEDIPDGTLTAEHENVQILVDGDNDVVNTDVVNKPHYYAHWVHQVH